MNKGFLGIGLLAYASWQTIHFLRDRGSRVWAKQRFHRYLPRPTAETLKMGKSCGNCDWFHHHPDFIQSGICTHNGWREALRSTDVMVKRAGHCELWKRSPVSAI